MKLTRARPIAALVAIVLATSAHAQTKPVAAPGSYVPQSAIAFGAPGGPATPVDKAHPLPVGQQESFALVAGNTPSLPATVFGGDYILAQTCATYGTLSLQVLGPDGATYQTLLTKSASDPGGGTGLALGSYAVVRVTVTGTTGCNALLSRVPA